MNKFSNMIMKVRWWTCSHCLQH